MVLSSFERFGAVLIRTAPQLGGKATYLPPLDNHEILPFTLLSDGRAFPLRLEVILHPVARAPSHLTRNSKKYEEETPLLPVSGPAAFKASAGRPHTRLRSNGRAGGSRSGEESIANGDSTRVPS